MTTEEKSPIQVDRPGVGEVDRGKLIKHLHGMLDDLQKKLVTKDQKRNFRLLVRVFDDVINTPKSNTQLHARLQRKATKYLNRIQGK